MISCRRLLSGSVLTNAAKNPPLMVNQVWVKQPLVYSNDKVKELYVCATRTLGLKDGKRNVKHTRAIVLNPNNYLDTLALLRQTWRKVKTDLRITRNAFIDCQTPFLIDMKTAAEAWKQHHPKVHAVPVLLITPHENSAVRQSQSQNNDSVLHAVMHMAYVPFGASNTTLLSQLFVHLIESPTSSSCSLEYKIMFTMPASMKCMASDGIYRCQQPVQSIFLHCGHATMCFRHALDVATSQPANRHSDTVLLNSSVYSLANKRVESATCVLCNSPGVLWNFQPPKNISEADRSSGWIHGEVQVTIPPSPDCIKYKRLAHCTAYSLWRGFLRPLYAPQIFLDL